MSGASRSFRGVGCRTTTVRHDKRSFHGEFSSDGPSRSTQRSQDIMTVLHDAVESNDLSSLRRLVDGGRINIDARNDFERTPLHVACIHNRMDIVRYLAKSGANIHAVGKKRRTSLHYAVLYHGNLEMVEFLVHKC
jgi:ankyrin repeat protein